MKMTYWLSGGTALAAAIGIAAFTPLLASGKTDKPAASVAALTPVAVASVISGPIPVELSGVGTLEAVNQVQVSPEVGGRIVQLNFTSGKSVSAGQVLIKLNDEREQGDMSKLQAQAKNARLALERTRKVLLLASTQSQLDQAQANFDQVRGDIASVQAVINQKTIRAPFAGVLGIRRANLGQYLNPGDPVVTLTDLSRLFVNFPMPEQTAAQLQPGQEVHLRVDAYPDRLFKATVSTLEQQIDPGARSMQVQATLDNPELLLKPGMFADVTISLPNPTTALTVPETAINYTAYGNSLFVVRDNDGQLKVEQVFVKVGPRHRDRIVVLDAIKPGDRVVISGQIKLSNGMPVRITEDAMAQNNGPLLDMAQKQ